MDAVSIGAVVIFACAVLALWDYGRRSINVKQTEADSAAKYEKAYQSNRDDYFKMHDGLHSLQKAFDTILLRTPKLESRVGDLELTQSAYHSSHNGLRTELERRIDEMEKRPTKDVETEVAIRELFSRAEKNSAAIVNTAESMQKLLNEKFTSLALKGGLQGRAG